MSHSWMATSVIGVRLAMKDFKSKDCPHSTVWDCDCPPKKISQPPMPRYSDVFVDNPVKITDEIHIFTGIERLEDEVLLYMGAGCMVGVGGRSEKSLTLDGATDTIVSRTYIALQRILETWGLWNEEVRSTFSLYAVLS